MINSIISYINRKSRTSKSGSIGYDYPMFPNFNVRQLGISLGYITTDPGLGTIEPLFNYLFLAYKPVMDRTVACFIKLNSNNIFPVRAFDFDDAFCSFCFIHYSFAALRAANFDFNHFLSLLFPYTSKWLVYRLEKSVKRLSGNQHM